MPEEKNQEQDQYTDTEKRIRIWGWIVAFLLVLILVFFQDYCVWRWPGDYWGHLFHH